MCIFRGQRAFPDAAEAVQPHRRRGLCAEQRRVQLPNHIVTTDEIAVARRQAVHCPARQPERGRHAIDSGKDDLAALAGVLDPGEIAVDMGGHHPLGIAILEPQHDQRSLAVRPGSVARASPGPVVR
jgi:hypothetical protein